MSRAKLVIGIRLHALILAIRFGVPFLAVPYDPKVRGLCEDLGYPLAPLWTPGVRSTPQQAADLADEAWSQHAELGTLLGEAARNAHARRAGTSRCSRRSRDAGTRGANRRGSMSNKTLNTDYRSTLLLPKTDFPMRADLPKREPERVAWWHEHDVYERRLERNAANGPGFCTTGRRTPTASCTWATS